MEEGIYYRRTVTGTGKTPLVCCTLLITLTLHIAKLFFVASPLQHIFRNSIKYCAYGIYETVHLIFVLYSFSRSTVLLVEFYISLRHFSCKQKLLKQKLSFLSEFLVFLKISNIDNGLQGKP